MHFNRRRDGRVFGRLTKGLALLAAGLLWLGGLGLLMDTVDPNPFWSKGLLFYCVTCYSGLMFYLIVFYADDTHDATTTYLNLLTPLIAFLLVPLTWPLLIVLNWVVFKRDRDAANRAEHNELMDDWT